MKTFVFLIKPLLVSEALHSLLWLTLGSSCQTGSCPTRQQRPSNLARERPALSAQFASLPLQCPFQPRLHPFHLVSLNAGCPCLTSFGARDAQRVVPVVRASKCTWHFRQPPGKAILSGTAPPSLPSTDGCAALPGGKASRDAACSCIPPK